VARPLTKASGEAAFVATRAKSPSAVSRTHRPNFAASPLSTQTQSRGGAVPAVSVQSTSVQVPSKLSNGAPAGRTHVWRWAGSAGRCHRPFLVAAKVRPPASRAMR
jgi:hypothetical protein